MVIKLNSSIYTIMDRINLYLNKLACVRLINLNSQKKQSSFIEVPALTKANAVCLRSVIHFNSQNTY